MASPALVLRFPSDDPFTRDLAAAEIDGTLATAIHDADDLEWRVFYSTRESRDTAREALAPFARARGLGIEAIDVEDEDWARRSQAQLTAVRIGGIIVAPPWDLPLGPEVVVVIEPSVGFGTGHHASTRLCLQAMQALTIRDMSVIDVGTGSGVLAIAAAKLGARSVTAIDTDGDAVQNARDNAARNGAAIDLHVADVGRAGLPFGRGRFDVVLANLTAAWLRRLAGPLLALAADTGVLVLSGLQTSERSHVTEAFVPPGQLMRELEEDGWTAIVVGRTDADSSINP